MSVATAAVPSANASTGWSSRSCDLPGDALRAGGSARGPDAAIGQQAAERGAAGRQQQRSPPATGGGCAPRLAPSAARTLISLLARRGARQQHVGDVAARDQQQQADCAEERVEHAAEAADHPVDDGDDLDARTAAGTRRGYSRARRAAIDVELGGGLLRWSRQAAGTPGTSGARLLSDRVPVERSGNPQVADVPLEARRHDADDRHAAAQLRKSGATDDPAVAAEERRSRCGG